MWETIMRIEFGWEEQENNNKNKEEKNEIEKKMRRRKGRIRRMNEWVERK